jgi:hypothetical protein
MTNLLAAMEDLKVTPLDCAGHGDMVYIAWETTALLCRPVSDQQRYGHRGACNLRFGGPAAGRARRDRALSR